MARSLHPSLAAMRTRVLVVTGIYPWVGNPQDAVFVRQQVRRLTQRGLDCQVLAFRYCPPIVPASLWRLRYVRHLETADSGAGFPVHDVFVSRQLDRRGDVVPRIANALTDHIVRTPALRNMDVIYAHWLWPAGAAALHLRRRFGRPVAAIARGSEMHHWQAMHPCCRPYVERVVREADCVLANCVALRDAAHALAPDTPRQIDVVYNGCDGEYFAPAEGRADARRMLGLAANDRAALFCGSMLERKGIRTLALAWQRFSATAPEWQLIAIGRLVETPLVRQLARVPRVRIVGPVGHDDVRTFMQAADAYVQPSIHEGLSNATMEAMATGLPVITTDTGGQRELIAHDVNGLLIPVEDAGALARALSLVAHDPARARQLGRRGREPVLSRFAPDRQVAKLVALLERTASAGRTAPPTAAASRNVPA